MRQAISPLKRLTATLRFLAIGRNYKDLEFSSIISKQALSDIIPETCEAIYKVLKKEYLNVNYFILLHNFYFFIIYYFITQITRKYNIYVF